MKVIIWYLAKGIEASALGVVGYALIVGVQSNNPTIELKWLLSGAVLFMFGMGLERLGGRDS